MRGPLRPGRARVALLINQPAPYRVPLYRELAQHLEFLAIFDERREPNRDWSVEDSELAFPHAWARGLGVDRWRRRPDLGYSERRRLQVRVDLIPRLASSRPQLVVSAEFGVRTLQAALYCKMARIPLIIWWEGTQHSEGNVSQLRATLRTLLVGLATRFWCNGCESRASLASYGARHSAIDEGINGVDTRTLHRKVADLAFDRARLRAELALRGTVILFVGRYHEAKGLRQYVAALERLHSRRSGGWTALFVGSGPHKSVIDNLRRRIPEIPVVDAGFVQPNRIAKYYAASDVFAFPTLDDVWGLASLEAAVAGLPQLCSIYAGCRPDILTDARCGWSFDPTNEQDFDRKLLGCVENQPQRLPGEIVEYFVDKFSIHATARRAAMSISAALSEGNRARPG